MLSGEYIFQEILEQERIAALHHTLSVPDWPAVPEKIIISGSGDSHCAALFGHWLLEKRGQVSGLPSLEASQTAQHLKPGDIFIGISVSGRTARVLEGAQRALSAGALVVAVTDNPQSPLAQLATVVWPIHASPAEELHQTNYNDEHAKQYVGYHHDVAQTKTFWAVLLTLIRAAQSKLDWHILLAHTRLLLATTFYEPLISKAALWAKSGQTFFLGSGWARIVARFASYKMHEFNRVAHFTGIEEYCHTHYFITRTSDTVACLIADNDTAARTAEVVPVLQELFGARIIWIQPGSLDPPNLPVHSNNPIEMVNLPPSTEPLQQFLDFVLALQWLTYSIGRVGAPDINTFHAGYDTEKLVSGTLRTIRRSVIQKPGPNKQTH
jgi:fructoselysine-6-P-deglycase FrlB-like protein